MPSAPTIFLSAAEASGDHHAAELIRQLRVRFPDARFLGAAGAKMAAAGCEVVADLTQQASMLGGPFLKLRYYRRMVRLVQQAVRDTKPDVVIPVDSPAFNWHIARAAKEVALPVMYYVGPQVWAWAPWRIKKVRRLTDHVACLLPFEEEYFRSRGVAATYVGHPLFDQLPPQRPLEACPDLFAASQSGQWRVALLPGSRPGEIASIAPALAATADAITHRYPDAICTFTAVDDAGAGRIRKATRREDLNIAVGNTPAILAESHFAVAASGTVVLEVAHFGLPLAVVYNVAGWQKIAYHLIARHLLRTKHLSLVNILADRDPADAYPSPLVPELMPYFQSPAEVAGVALSMLNDVEALQETRENLLALTAPLATKTPGGASANVATIVAELLEEKKEQTGI